MAKRLSIGNEKFVKAAVLFALAPAFFCQTLLKQPSLQIGVLVLSFIMLAIASIRGSNRMSFTGPYVAWVLFFLFALFVSQSGASNVGVRWSIMFGLCLVMIPLLSSLGYDTWPIAMVRAISVIGFFYGMVTVVTFVFPDVYTSFIKPMFFRNVIIGTAGYRSGFTSHYSTNGIYLSLGAIASTSLCLHKRTRWRVLALVVTGLALVLTAKRAHLVFCIASLLIIAFVINRRGRVMTTMRVVVALVIAAVVFMLVSILVPDLSLILDRFARLEDDETIGGRRSYYELCLSMWGQAPLFGNGWHSYTDNFNMTSLGLWYVQNGSSNMKAHNVYLQVLAEQGLVGEILFLVALLSGIRVSLTLFQRSFARNSQRFRKIVEMVHERSEIFYALAACLGVQIFFALYCLTGNPLYDMQVYIPFMLCLGACMCAVSQLTENARFNRVRASELQRVR